MFRRFAFIVFLALLSSPAVCDDLAQQLQNDFQNQVFIIRGFYQDEVLKYDSSGVLKQPGDIGSWTTSFVLIQSVGVHKHKIEIKGVRELQVFDIGTRTFQPVQTTDKVVLNIERDPDSDADSVRKSVAAAFITKDALPSSVPPEWRWVFAQMGPDGVMKKLPKPWLAVICPQDLSGENCPETDKRIKPPHITNSPTPDYGKLSRSARIQGSVALSLIVDESGKPRNIIVTLPIGGGLDERAIATLKRWTFEPATLDGKPIPVAIAVQFKFKLF